MAKKESLGLTGKETKKKSKKDVIKYINLKLASLGKPYFKEGKYSDLGLVEGLINNSIIKERLNDKALAPVDQRIQNFLNDYYSDTEKIGSIDLPNDTFVLDQYGLARELSLPAGKNEFHTDIIESYRIAQGVLHNPKSDRRTTKGVFHVVEGGLPIPDDKKSVPKYVFTKFLHKAFNNVPSELMQLPFTAAQDEKAETFVSLLLKPMVCPEVKGYTSQKNFEVRFIVPGNLVANLDFVESIFSNGGDPYLPENDSALTPDNWTGHTGCVILAPQLLGTTKKELGLPNIADATERQKRDGMCWEKEDELYNDGSAFKITCRDERGVIVTIICDNYFGYCKKEVKTQIGYSANLFGLTEEEHAGGAMAFPSYNNGTHFYPNSMLKAEGHTFQNVIDCLGDEIEVKPEGYAVDKNYDSIVYIPEDAEIFLESQEATWTKDGEKQSIKIQPGVSYVNPTGYKVEMQKHPKAPTWRLVGTVAEGTLCHKPCTVSGGGKSEISKSLLDATYAGPVFVNNFEEDMKAVQELIDYDYSKRLIDPPALDRGSRALLSSDRSLGSVIKLLTPSELFVDEYNHFLETIPSRIKAILFMVKRFYKEEWGSDWKTHFSVDEVNGEPAHELKYEGRKLVGSYLRVGKDTDGAWRTFKLRQDFLPAEKIQWEDDISASITIPADQLEDLNPEYKNTSVKIVENCEYRFFQRPDDAIIRGYDEQAELDLASPNSFISNFQPLGKAEVTELAEDAMALAEYTEPMKNLIKETAANMKDDEFMVCSSKPRIVDGKPTKNPRYLQLRQSLVDSKPLYLSQVGTRLHRKVAAGKPVHTPVNSVLTGRRNNPAEPGIRPLAVYNPVHFQELPELFADFMCSLTGKSPSTTGAGSEGALTKGPFNALLPVTDLNNALLSFILGDYNGYSTAAGYIGHKYKMDHDISLLVPELWARLSETERDPKFLEANGYLEKINDFEHGGETIKGSRLGYRITKKFAATYLGRVFDQPSVIFPDDMIQPELQSLENYVDGIKNICEGQEKVAKAYIADGGVEAAIPPFEAVLRVLAEGSYNGKQLDDPEVRALFDRDAVIKSDWYKARLVEKQRKDVASYEKHQVYLTSFIEDDRNIAVVAEQGLVAKLAEVEEKLAYFKTDAYVESLVGTLGADVLKK